MTNYFFKSDFSIRESSQNYNTYPFIITFWTDKPSNTFKCEWDGTTYKNCHLASDGALIVDFVKHGLGVGVLKAEKVFYIPDANSIDGVKKASSVGWYDVKLAFNHDAIITDEATGAVFAGAAVTFPDGKGATDEEDDTTVYNDIEAVVSGSKLILNI